MLIKCPQELSFLRRKKKERKKKENKPLQYRKTQDKTRHNVEVYEQCAADKIAREL